MPVCSGDDASLLDSVGLLLGTSLLLLETSVLLILMLVRGIVPAAESSVETVSEEVMKYVV